MSKRKRIYIAGPYSGGDVAVNVANAMAMWHQLWDRGYSPFCPHLSHFLHLQQARPYGDWTEHDNDWLEVCDAMIRMPGHSPGADAEASLAETLEIPVVATIADLDALW